MKRRGFLGALGAAIVGGPKTIAKAIPTDLSGLIPTAVAFSGQGISDHGTPDGMSSGDDIPWAKAHFAKLKNMTPLGRKLKYRQFYIHALDTNTASLRSMSLGYKMQMSKRIQFARYEADKLDYFDAVIKKVIDY